MSEEMQSGSSPEELRLSQEENERIEAWEKYYAEKVIAPEDRRECGPEIAEFEEMLASFESTHSLTELHLIGNLTTEEALKHPTREPARLALYPIVSKLNLLKEETNISSEKYEELYAKFMHLSRAVGMIRNNKVDHDRLADISGF